MADKKRRGDVDTIRGALAFFADIHGNLAALKAVMVAARQMGAGAFYAAGDLVHQGDEPLEVWTLLQEAGVRCVRGTTDLALATLDPAKMKPSNEEEERARDRFLRTREALGELILAKLKRLPEALRLELPDGTEVLVVHGSPRDPDEAITLDFTDDELEAVLANETADVVICGSSHTAFVREVGSTQVVGVGSVGASPEGRVAHYSLLMTTPDGPVIDQRWVEY